MEIKSNYLILETQDKNRLNDFLCDVLEFDLNPITKIMNLGPVSVKIAEIEIQKVTPLEFSFILHDHIEIEAIKKKFDFFVYRHHNEPVKEEISILENDNIKILTLTDIDKRKWQFHYEKMH